MKKLTYADIPAYKEKSNEWWRKADVTFDTWVQQKYDYCRYNVFTAIVDKDEDDGDNSFIYPKIFEILTAKNYIRPRPFAIDAAQLYEAFKKYSQFVSEINEYIVFIPSIQTFCAFCNLSVQEINALADNDEIKSHEQKMRNVINVINDYFVTSLTYAGQMGIASPSIVSSMLKQDGQGLTTTAKETPTEKQTTKPMAVEDIKSKLQEMKKNKKN